MLSTLCIYIIKSDCQIYFIVECVVLALGLSAVYCRVTLPSYFLVFPHAWLLPW